MSGRLLPAPAVTILGDGEQVARAGQLQQLQLSWKGTGQDQRALLPGRQELVEEAGIGEGDTRDIQDEPNATVGNRGLDAAVPIAL
ncbi:hypothetical protein [Streptomyces sp. NPDC002082]|uniref:hypothetical protein n=1 Tax=Streptomyces sp. NPDC002082 TaxID=3154772 RepID=UPI003317C64F